MENARKQKISRALKERMEQKGLSQPAVAKEIGDMNATTINFMVNEKWKSDPQLVSENNFNKVAAWLRINSQWKIVPEVTNYTKIWNLAAAAKKHKNAKCIISDSCGAGKGEALKALSERTKNTFYIECRLFFSRKDFLWAIQKAMGVKTTQGLISQIFDDLIQELNKRTDPLLIIDEAELLSDGCLPLANDIYNGLRGNVGFIFAGTRYLEDRIEKGVKKNKQGFNNMYSRIGGQFYYLKKASHKDVKLVCEENGIKDSVKINEIYNQCQGDLRQVEALATDLTVAENK